jgi:hypothetical protein
MEMKPYGRLASGIAGLLIAGAFFTTFGLAHDESEDAPVILSPVDGATVRGPVTVIVGFNDASGAMHDNGTKPVMNDATKQMGQTDHKEQMGQMGNMHGDAT